MTRTDRHTQKVPVLHSITRRGLFKGLALAGATAAVVGVLPGCTHTDEDSASEPVVADEDSGTSILDSYTEADLPLSEGETWSLPLGCVLRVGEGTYVPVIRAGASASPMVRACALSTQDGQLSEVVAKPLGEGTNVVIYDVKCSDSVYAWVELDLLTHGWSLYASDFSNGALSGSTTTLWQADANYDPPLFSCTGDRVIWQVMPATAGEKTSEASYCYLWHRGDANAEAVVESPGRFATAPAVSGGTVTLTPRVRADEGTFYGITAYSLDNDMAQTVDQLVMPETVRPFHAVRINNRFVFSVEASYSSGGLLAGMGTYIGTGSGPYIVLSREPAAEVAGKGDVLLIKSRASYFVVDTSASTYSILSAANRCIDYGEYPAREGETDTFVTFAAVKDADTGYPASVTVRTFGL